MVLLGSDVGMGSRANVNLVLTSYLIPSMLPKVKLNENLTSLTAHISTPMRPISHDAGPPFLGFVPQE